MTDWTSPSGDPGAPPPEQPPAPPVYPPAYPAQYPPAYGQAPSPYGWAPAWTPKPGVVPLRPLGLGELLDGGIKVMRTYPKPTLGLSAALSAVATTINVLFTLAFVHVPSLDSVANDSDGTSSSTFNTNANVASLPGKLLLLVGGLVLTGAMVSVVGKAVLGQPTTFAEVWAQIKGRLWALLGTALLSGLIITGPVIISVILGIVTGGIGFLLLLVAIPAALYLWVRVCLAPAALVLERIGVFAALRRSAALAHRDFWRMLGILLLTALITGFIGLVLAIPFGIFIGVSALNGGGGLGTGLLVGSAIVTGIAQVITAPYSAGIRALLYVDARMRSEGLDVALQTAAATNAQPTL